jgi:DNA-binding PucR family transcriptional regulator
MFMALFKKTVDSILADVQAKIDQLQALADAELATARVKREQAQRALYDADAAQQEAERALRVANKIEELVR